MRFTKVVHGVCVAVISSLSMAACGGDKDKSDEARGEGHEEHSVAPAPAVKPTGRSTTINMITDSKGERYDPKEVTLDRGDSLHFVLQSGVHNVHFMPDKSEAGAKLPPMSEYLQLPGQKMSYLIHFPDGRYFFQCDIHVALGMTGWVNVGDQSP